MSNTFGTLYRLTTFGESHGPAIGGVIDGMPAGLAVDTVALARAMGRRRPGQSALSTSRVESDQVELLSGLMDGVTTGAPIGFIIRNTSQRSGDYDNLCHTFRPSHADYTYTAKYGLRDHRGGGRSSARETACRVVGGALATQALARYGIEVRAYTSAVGTVECAVPYTSLDLSLTDDNAVRCPDARTAALMEDVILGARKEGDTVGGVVTCLISGVPAGLGEPVFGRLTAMLAGSMMSINATRGVEFGDGFESSRRRGSEDIDTPVGGDFSRLETLSNHSGGIQGGISNGQDIVLRVAFKPVATMLRSVETVDDSFGPTSLEVRGRHDPCVVPRAVPVVEAMAAMTILDALLLNRTSRI